MVKLSFVGEFGHSQLLGILSSLEFESFFFFITLLSSFI